MNNYEIVTDIRVINKFIKKGLVEPCRQTGTKITALYGGKPFTCTYIDTVPKQFEENGYIYFEQYVDGCFYPYLARKRKSN